MKVEKFQVENGYSKDVIITVNLTTKTPSGKSSFYNGLVLKYNSSTNGNEQTISGNSILILLLKMLWTTVLR